MQTLAHCQCLVALELEQPLFLDATSKSPGHLLDRNSAEQLTAHLATDLEALLPGVARNALAVSGALYDPAQLLRPGLPLFDALQNLLQASFQGSEFMPRTLSFGAAEGRMPATALQPDNALPLGTMVLIPLLVSGEPARITPLSERMESEFMEQGQLSANTLTWLQASIGHDIVHGRFMTLTDLAAMVSMQLDSVGLGGLWQLLDHALFTPAKNVRVQTEEGLDLTWNGQLAEHRFLPFDHWADRHLEQWSGLEGDARHQWLQSGYERYTLQLRQYLVSLNAHRVTLSHLLPGNGQVAEDGSWLVSEGEPVTLAGAANLTHQSTEQLGLVAMTLDAGERLQHYYPMAPGGLEAIQDHLRSRLPENTVMAYPGQLCMDPDQPRLIPDVQALH